MIYSAFAEPGDDTTVPNLLTGLFVLSTILPLPIWALLIIAPRSQMTRRVADSYLIFVILGAFFIFMVVGVGVSTIDVLTQGGVAITTPTPTQTATVTQTATSAATVTSAGATAAATGVATSAATGVATESQAIATAAATASASTAVISAGPPAPVPFSVNDLLATPFLASLALLAWISIVSMNLLAGHWMYHEAIRQNAPVIVSSVCIFFTFLLGPLGVFIFVIARALTLARREAIIKSGGTVTPGRLD